jgi:hypothetical protein
MIQACKTLNIGYKQQALIWDIFFFEQTSSQIDNKQFNF